MKYAFLSNGTQSFYLGTVVILPLRKEFTNNDGTIELTLESKWVLDVAISWVKCNEIWQVQVRKYRQYSSLWALQFLS